MALRHEPADLRVAVLRALADGSSIAEAARALGMSYRAAWQALDTLTNLAGVALVERAVGGSGGGGARLTPAGQQVLQASAQLEAARAEVLRTIAASGNRGALKFSGTSQPSDQGASLAVEALGLRTSMRNVCHAVVTQVELSRPAALVSVRIANFARPYDPTAEEKAVGEESHAEVSVRLTRESAELLGLVPGLRVLLLCKAMAARIEPWAGLDAMSPKRRISASRRLPADAYSVRTDESTELLAATVLRTSRAAKNAALREITVALRDAPAVSFVGLASADVVLRRGTKVGVHLDPASLVIALPR
jgi:molybdate transport system regulatory protein